MGKGRRAQFGATAEWYKQHILAAVAVLTDLRKVLPPPTSAGKGWLDVAERLAEAGADPHIKNSKGWLAIQVSAAQHSTAAGGGTQLQGQVQCVK